MTNKILEQRILALEESIEEINKANDEGEEFDYSIAIDNMNGALEIIKELQSKPCEYIYQGKGTSFCKLAASHGKELEEARRVIEELRAQLESKNELISNLINGE